MSLERKFNSVFDVLGMLIKEAQPHRPDIQDFEVALLEVIYLAEKDLKVFGVLISWSKIHCDSIIFEKLEKHYQNYTKIKGETVVYNIFLIFCSEYGKRRIKNRCKRFKSKIVFPDSKTTEVMLKRSSAIKLLKEFNIYMPEKSLRIREEDILSIKDLISKNKQYKNRYIYGPSWRSDVIFHIHNGVSNPFEVSKLIGCSYEPANRIWNQYKQVFSGL